ncbi:hypothetical protein N7489_007763 [Penicillium chrysogenum]|uniref:Uncharacterized protein n=1 Tax=Penicillium chrysogenum TaxID=5076 RepID=A0ABQ8WBS8_PENCH|nr:uncharacterized protein N7489_007763 [Penicillium chrysogenum]KAJ5237672.1 hypothetical protein N7489_007763 [Penicillium chrysogenum]KAJ5262063.1 hypothetical protein N7505_008930 [Penicillium chrysogenum]KAJ5277973.1 hypothetical protein N7524_004126 [Penicillium chrysogenum]KAJ6159992.1 hypothetical protein N7497_004529 [Penicillium chrysogenum]
MDSLEYFISWGSERYVPLQRFEDLQPPRHDLIRYYGEVLDTAQTFTQHFSKRPLKSYDIERSLSKNMGRDPSCWNEDANSASISWLDIVRHGDFEQQSDGSYHCSIQGRVLEFDPQSHDRVEFCRSHAVQISNSGPSHEEVKREARTTLRILTDISGELSDFPRYKRSLENLERALKIRMSELQSILDSMAVSPTSTSPPAQYLTPREPDTAVGSERPRASSPAQSCSSSGSSGSETTSDDDCKRSMDSSSEDSSEDDESEDENAEESPEDNGAEDEDLDGMVREEKRTEDGSSKNGSSQQRNNNSDIGGNVAQDDDTVGTSPMPLTGEHKNALSAPHISPPGHGKARSASAVSLRDFSPSSLPPKTENDVEMNRTSQKDLALGMHKSPPKRLRKGCNTRAGNNRQPNAHACKRRKSTDVSESQKNRKSNCQERSVAVAWMKAHAHEGWNESERARAYESTFGIKRTTTTLKHWMDDPKNSQESRIVELKVPSPRLREILSNDDYRPTTCLSSGNLSLAAYQTLYSE